MESADIIADLFERLDRERLLADRAYNDALTALDRAFDNSTEIPQPPVFSDSSQLERLNASWKIAADRPAPERSLKGRLRGFFWRTVAPSFDAQERFNALVVDHLNRHTALHAQATRACAELVAAARQRVESLVRFEFLLLQFLQTVTAYVDTKDRSIAGSEIREQLSLIQQRLAMVEREMTRANATQPVVGGAPTSPGVSAGGADVPPAFTDFGSVKYLGFEDRFRGSSATIRERLTAYLPLFTGADNVVDIGCGRGELLVLLREQGVRARGVDSNQAMVDECVSRGLSVERDDALTYLSRQADGSLGGLVAIQVVEHFDPGYLLRFLEAAYQKLRAGAPLVLETINPACWMAFFETYIRDLTHVRPLHPDTLRYLVQATGFTSANVEYRQPVTEQDRLERVALPGVSDETLAAIGAVVNAHADKLNARLFSSMDYAVVARR